MKKNYMKLLSVIAGASVLAVAGVGVALNQGILENQVKAATNRSLIVGNLTGDITTNAWVDYTTKTALNNAVKFKGFGVCTLGNMWMSAVDDTTTDHFFYNVTPFSSIKSMAFGSSNTSNGTLTVYWGASANSTTYSATVTGGSTMTNMAGYHYFRLKAVPETGKTFTLLSLTINYTCAY